MVGLFQRDITVAVLSSGSAGNCTYVSDGRAGVLIDCGISTRRILARMDGLGIGDWPIDAVLITHEHSDHIGSSRVLAKALRKRQGKAVPFFMTRGTDEGAHPNSRPEGIEYVESGVPFRVRHLLVEAFTVPHDVLDPVAYKVGVGDVNVAVITDLGRPTALVARKMRDCDVLVLEYNHDLVQLMDGAYPWHLKQRIRSNHGHLSNQQASNLLVSGMGPRLKYLALAHLSEENNTPDKALASARAALAASNWYDVDVFVATQNGMTEPIRIKTNVW
ncbi:MAG: MBL fold metallo-hydrolase [Proteobacteria bacterium]|nr:MBL fold metallo-hydrolase [Pseudomonadota bacterium]